MGDIEGRRVLITGASRGIGAQIARDLAAAGARVAVNFIASDGPAQEVVDGIRAAGGTAFAVRADIGHQAEVEAMFTQIGSEFGGLDILVNNAGLSRDRPFLDMSEEDWDAVMDTNLKGPFLCAQAAARMMQAQSPAGGRIINISAITALVGRANAANYSASKGGVDALTRALAVELAPAITVNAIALGFFDSPLVRELYTAEQIADVEGKLPAGRLGRFDEVAGLVRYLSSDAAAFLTGQVITLDGGQIMRMA